MEDDESAIEVREALHARRRTGTPEERQMLEEIADRLGVPTPIQDCWTRFDEALGEVVSEFVAADGRTYRFTVD